MNVFSQIRHISSPFPQQHNSTSQNKKIVKNDNFCGQTVFTNDNNQKIKNDYFSTTIDLNGFEIH